jgi:hypothetical protein
MTVRLIHSASKSNAQPSADEKDRMIVTLRELLRETCRLRNQGAAYAKLAHAQGYADGYMRVLVEAGFVTNQDLLDIIRDVRRGVDGPATRTLGEEVPSSASVVSA